MDIADMTDIIHRMLDYGVFMDPLLVHTYFRDGTDALDVLANDMTEKLYGEYIKPGQFNAALGELPFSTRLMRMCVRETILSTAITLSYERIGSMYPELRDVIEATSKVEEMMRCFGPGQMYIIYFVIAGYDLSQPLSFYRTVTEVDFLDGIRHHPYKPDALDLFLIVGLASGSLRLKVVNQQRVIQLTRLGTQRLLWMRSVLEQSGYYAKRVALAYMYQFNSVKDWDEMCRVVWPNADECRRVYVNWVGVNQGTTVLEIECGTGAPRFGGELCNALGPQGRLIAIDVSDGVLHQAKEKARINEGPAQVQFQQASAEHLPFPDEYFDTVLGCAFLHFADGQKALLEMTRVVKPGGVVSVQQGLHFTLERPFFRDWFQPIYQIAGKRNSEQHQSYLPDTEHLKNWFLSSGLEQIKMESGVAQWVFDNPEMVVQHMVRSVSFFQRELMSLPWDYQRTLISELIDRGRDVCRKYPLSERVIEIPSVMIKGFRPIMREPDSSMPSMR